MIILINNKTEFKIPNLKLISNKMTQAVTIIITTQLHFWVNLIRNLERKIYSKILIDYC